MSSIITLPDGETIPTLGQGTHGEGAIEELAIEELAIEELAIEELATLDRAYPAPRAKRSLEML